MRLELAETLPHLLGLSLNQNQNNMTKVKFYLEKDSENDVFAYFPELVWCHNTKTCYAHIGQHSACHPDYIKECKEASLPQYLDLFNELQSIGYNDLVLI